MASREQAVEILIPEPQVSGFADDFRVARAIVAGDRLLFKVIYDKNAPALYALARRLVGNSAEADDVVQECFVRAYQKMALFAGRSTLSSWLYRICINVGLEYLRRRKGGREDLPESSPGAAQPDQHTVVLKSKLDAAIQKLPEGCKTVFILHDIEGFNHKEIAQQLHISEGTSKSQLFKARAMLRRLLVNEGRRR